jgi:hypothetical protein
MNRRLGLSFLLFLFLITTKHSYACETYNSLSQEYILKYGLVEYLSGLIGRIIVADILDSEFSNETETKEHAERLFIEYCVATLKLTNDHARACFSYAWKDCSIRTKVNFYTGN